MVAIPCSPEMTLTAAIILVGIENGMVLVVTFNFPRQAGQGYHNGWCC